MRLRARTQTHDGIHILTTLFARIRTCPWTVEVHVAPDPLAFIVAVAARLRCFCSIRLHPVHL